MHPMSKSTLLLIACACLFSVVIGLAALLGVSAISGFLGDVLWNRITLAMSLLVVLGGLSGFMLRRMTVKICNSAKPIDISMMRTSVIATIFITTFLFSGLLFLVSYQRFSDAGSTKLDGLQAVKAEFVAKAQDLRFIIQNNSNSGLKYELMETERRIHDLQRESERLAHGKQSAAIAVGLTFVYMLAVFYFVRSSMWNKKSQEAATSPAMDSHAEPEA
jgi:hypothetical protein